MVKARSLGELTQSRRLRPSRRPALLVLLLTVLVGCGDDDRVASDREGLPNVSPTAVASLPDAIEEATVRVAGGAFAAEELVLLEDEPTVLHVVNGDDRPYRLRVVEDLVGATPIAAQATTDVAFTTPNAGVYEGRLLRGDRDEVLDTVRVVVQEAGGTEP